MRITCEPLQCSQAQEHHGAQVVRLPSPAKSAFRPRSRCWRTWSCLAQGLCWKRCSSWEVWCVVGHGCINLTLRKKVGREGESSFWRMLTRFWRSALAAMLLDHEAAVVRVRAGRMLQDVEIVLFFFLPSLSWNLRILLFEEKNPGSFTWREDLVVLATHVSKAGTEPLSNWKLSNVGKQDIKTASISLFKE